MEGIAVSKRLVPYVPVSEGVIIPELVRNDVRSRYFYFVLRQKLAIPTSRTVRPMSCFIQICFLRNAHCRHLVSAVEAVILGRWKQPEVLKSFNDNRLRDTSSDG